MAKEGSAQCSEFEADGFKTNLINNLMRPETIVVKVLGLLMLSYYIFDSRLKFI